MSDNDCDISESLKLGIVGIVVAAAVTMICEVVRIVCESGD